MTSQPATTPPEANAEPREAIFISHAAPEDNAFTIWLGAKLAAIGDEVWADVLRLKDWQRTRKRSAPPRVQDAARRPGRSTSRAFAMKFRLQPRSPERSETTPSSSRRAWSPSKLPSSLRMPSASISRAVGRAD